VIRKQRKFPERVGPTLLSIVGNLDAGSHFDILRLIKEWPEVVGEAIARRTEVASLKFHVATIKVSSAMWIQELNMMKLQILNRLCDAVGGDSVRDIRFVKGSLSRRERPRLRPVPRSSRRAIKLPPIKDPELKRAFEDLVEAWGRAPR
jgi:hypothetical protein